ncbi:MAG: DDE-type integrase/transposase/recombinase [Gammaproteobacteria bacterium]
MNHHETESVHERWARLRFAIIGPLLAAPPPAGTLRPALAALAAKPWRHPLSGAPVRFGFATVERGYYRARHSPDPVAALCQAAHAQYQAHPSGSYQLHYDNLAVQVKQHPTLGALPSYATLRRYMKAQGWVKRRRCQSRTPGQGAAEQRLAEREVRSFEATYTHALWHVDFHQGSRPVLSAEGRWVRPWLLGVLDDDSRLACHVQWYLAESAETLVHGLSQAFQKRALPRALLSDNGGAMLAEEVRQGLARLGVMQETTLPYSPYQNAKQEVFWASVEGRLLAMLEGVEALTLE